MRIRRGARVLGLAVVLASAGQVWANTTISVMPGLTLFQLPSLNTVPASYSYGGVAFDSAANTLLLAGGDAGSGQFSVWEVPVVRTFGHITSFGAPVQRSFAASPDPIFGVVAAGVTYAAGSSTAVLFATRAAPFLGQFSTANSVTDESGLGLQLGDELGGLGYSLDHVLKLSTRDGYWFDVNATVSAGAYSFSVGAGTQLVPASSFTYVAAGGLLGSAGVVAGDSSNLVLRFYQLNGNNPDPSQTVEDVATLTFSDTGAFLGRGVTVDPLTGDLLFTTTDSAIYLLRAEVPEPSTLALSLGAIGLALARRYRRKA